MKIPEPIRGETIKGYEERLQQFCETENQKFEKQLKKKYGFHTRLYTIFISILLVILIFEIYFLIQALYS